MSKEFWQVIAFIIMAIVITALGIQGVARKDKIKNRADYIMSVGQIMGGITAFIFLIIYFSLKMSGHW